MVVHKNNYVWNFFDPDIYLYGKYPRVQENDFETRFWPILLLRRSAQTPLYWLGEKFKIIS